MESPQLVPTELLLSLQLEFGEIRGILNYMLC